MMSTDGNWNEMRSPASNSELNSIVSRDLMYHFSGYATDMVKLEYKPIPLKGKRPLPDEWTKVTGTDITRMLGYGEKWTERDITGYGILLGTPAGKGYVLIAVDIDLDDYDQIEEVRSTLPVSSMIKKGKKGMTLFYRTTPELAAPRVYKRLVGDVREGMLDYLGTGRQTVMPGSIHPDTGKRYQWIEGTGPVPAHTLPILTEDHIVEMEEMLASLGWDRRYTEREGRHQIRAVVEDGELVAGSIMWLNRMALDNIPAWVEDLALFNGVWRGARYCAVNTMRSSSTGRPASKRKRNLSVHPTGIKDFGSNETFSPLDLVRGHSGLSQDDAYEWLAERVDPNWGQDGGLDVLLSKAPKVMEPERRQTGKAPRVKGQRDESWDHVKQTWEAEDRSLLDDEIAPAPALPLHIFGNARPVIEKIAKAMNAAPDYPAGMLVAAATALIGKLYTVQATPAWQERLSVWIALVGQPGTGKTPSISPIRSALDRVQSAMVDAWRIRMDRRIAEAQLVEDNEREVEKLEYLRAQTPRYVVMEATVEAIACKESVADRGLLLFRDELAGLLKSFDQYRKGGDRQYMLEAWSGGGYTVDRKTLGASVEIENHLFSIVGCMQPDVVRDNFASEDAEDGFAARFDFFWPAPIKPAPLNRDPFDTGFITRIFQKLENSFGLEMAAGPSTLQLTEEALHVFDKWRYEVCLPRTISSTGALTGAGGKLPGKVLRYAGILHILDWACSSDETPLSKLIDQQRIQESILLIENYILPQTKRALGQGTITAADVVATAIIRHCQQHNLAEFNLREAQRAWAIAGCRRDKATKTFDEAAKLLIEANLIRSIKSGRAKAYEVNPAIHTK